jgi:hypothetical protein
MLEISVFCVMLVAAAYWTTMFVMGRRDDVIHGKFVHTEEEGDMSRSSMPVPPPPFPKRPIKAAQPANIRPGTAEARPVNSAALESLLAAIQQDLKSMA